jgi:hypothetical protein
MMEPVGLLIVGKKQRIKYRCTLCHVERIFDAANNDSANALIELSKRRFI